MRLKGCQLRSNMKNLVLLTIIVAVTFFWCGYEYGIAKTAKSGTNANMPPTNFSGADLNGANLTGVRIDGVILCNTTMHNGTINSSSC